MSAQPAAASHPFAVRHDRHRVRTSRSLEFLDVTGLVADAVRRSGIADGVVQIQTLHTTAAVVVNEHEPLLLRDFADRLRRFAPTRARYRHDDPRRRKVNVVPGERPNGHAHVRALCLGASETLGVAGGAIALGRWQRVFLVELDGPRERELAITVLGAAAAAPAVEFVAS